MKKPVFCLFMLIGSLCSAQQAVRAFGSGAVNASDAAWTSATGGNTAVNLISNTSGFNSILVTLVQGTTITGGVVTFEQSIDNSTFTTVQGVTVGATTIMGPTYTLVASTNVSFLFPVNAPYFRIRLSTVITGSGTVTVQHASQTLPTASLLAGTETLANGGNACFHPQSTLISVFNGATSGTANVQIVALSGTTKIYVCSLTVIGTSGTTPTFALITGTGTACATGQTNLTFAFSTTSTTVPTTFSFPIGVTAAGGALCYVQTGTTPIAKYILTYVQQ